MKKVFRKKLPVPDPNKTAENNEDQEWKELHQYIKMLFSDLPKEDKNDMKEE